MLFADDISRFNCKVYDKRWGTALSASHQLLSLKIALRMGWNRARYIGGHGVDGDGNGGGSRGGEDAPDLCKVHDGIESKRVTADNSRSRTLKNY